MCLDVLSGRGTDSRHSGTILDLNDNFNNLMEMFPQKFTILREPDKHVGRNIFNLRRDDANVAESPGSPSVKHKPLKTKTFALT